MPKRMTQRQRNRIADELLCAAKHWQNGHESVAEIMGHWAIEYYDPHDSMSSFDHGSEVRRTESASAALSDAAGLGFDIVDAKTGR